jgi:hypothetical protein
MTNTTPTRGIKRAAILIVFSLALPNAAAAQINYGATGPVLPDPVPDQGTQYPPSAVTAGTAYGGPPKIILHNQCTAFNPCAQASSAPHKLGPLINAND